jgi:hypothetical protein
VRKRSSSRGTQAIREEQSISTGEQYIANLGRRSDICQLALQIIRTKILLSWRTGW